MKEPPGSKHKYFSVGHIAKSRELSGLMLETELFKGFNPAELAASFVEAEIHDYSAGTVIFRPEEESCERLYILRKGRVEMYRLTANGNPLVNPPDSSRRCIWGKRTIRTGQAKEFRRSCRG